MTGYRSTLARWLLLPALLAILVVVGGWGLGVGSPALRSLTPIPQPPTPASPPSLMEVPPHGAVGQTFVARQAALQGIELFLAIDGSNGEGQVTLHLRSSTQADEPDLRTAQLRLPLPAPPAWYRFDFPAVAQSDDRLFYFYLEGLLPEGATLRTGDSPGSTYQDGALYVDHRPQDAQLAFQLNYGPASIAYSLIGWLGQAAKMLLAMGLLCILPGLALQTYLLPMPSRAWKERLGLAAGLSLSLYPLLLLWAEVLHVRPGAATVWLPVGLAGVALAWRWIRWRRLARLDAGWNTRQVFPSLFPDLVWLAAVVVVFCVRLYVLESADAPMWGDSVQHAVISQLLVDHGGLFDSWLPYAPYQTLTVHFGFHSIVAAIMWLSGEPVLSATLLAGQIVNFLAILTLVPVAHRLIQNRWAGLGAVIVAGVLSPLPNGYTNWGRYSQLAGQAIMPIAIWLTWSLFGVRGWGLGVGDREPDPSSPNPYPLTPNPYFRERRWQGILLTGIAWAGTLLAYYRMPHYVAVFVASVVAVCGAGFLRRGWRAVFAPVSALIGSGLVALALALPWLLQIRSSTLAESVEAGLTQGSALASVWAEYQAFVHPHQYLPIPLILLAVGVGVWAVARRQIALIVIVLWTIGVLLLPASRFVRLPGGNKQQGFAILISLYIPVGLLVGFGVDAALEWFSRKGRKALTAALAGFTVLVLPPAYAGMGAVDPAYRILAPADLRAMEWIREHVGPDALFLVDGFLIYGGTSVVGSDGGWWIPLLTGRKNTMPPQYALLSEQPVDPKYNQFVVSLVAELRKVGVTSPEGIAILCRSHITHVYVGQGQGRIALPPPEPMLSITSLEMSPAFRPIYRQDKIGVFALHESACRL